MSFPRVGKRGKVAKYSCIYCWNKELGRKVLCQEYFAIGKVLLSPRNGRIPHRPLSSKDEKSNIMWKFNYAVANVPQKEEEAI